MELTGSQRGSVVFKRLEPAVAQRTRLVAERWLPALGLGDCCPRLLGVAADSQARWVWHASEDLGPQTLADRPSREDVEAVVDLVAELHTRAANHAVLPDARRYGGGLGMGYFTANVRDAISALVALNHSGIAAPPEHEGVAHRLLERVQRLLDDAPRRARAFQDAGGPDTLLHGDLWPINAFVLRDEDRLRACLVDWDRAGVGPFSYDLSTFLVRYPARDRPSILERYREAVRRSGWRLAPTRTLELLFDTAERARYANRVIWPARALVGERAAWGFPELTEVERWFLALDEAPIVSE